MAQPSFRSQRAVGFHSPPYFQDFRLVTRPARGGGQDWKIFLSIDFEAYNAGIYLTALHCRPSLSSLVQV